MTYEKQKIKCCLHLNYELKVNIVLHFKNNIQHHKPNFITPERIFYSYSGCTFNEYHQEHQFRAF